MKKILTLAVCALLALGAQAQLVTSTSQIVKTQPKEKRTQWMVRVGAGTNNIKGDGLDDVVSSKAGYFLGIEFNSHGRRGGYYGLDFALTSRGYSFDGSVYGYMPGYGYTSYDMQYKQASHAFEFSPLIFGWKINIADSKFDIDPHIGLLVSVDYAGKRKDCEVDGYEADDVALGDISGYWRLDVGLRAGVGVWFDRKYNLDFSYQHGFMGMDDSFDIKCKAFMVRLGYAF